MNDNKIIIMVGVVAAILLIVLIFVFAFITKKKESEGPEFIRATINFWGVTENVRAYGNIISQFKATYPNITIKYTFFENEEEYERKLLEAMALGQGPDIYMVRNNDIQRNIDRITPLPITFYRLTDIRRDFPEIVEEDLIRGDFIYGLPLYIDTLALLYNKDMFNRAALPFPPETWDEVKQMIPLLAEYENEGTTIKRAAIAMGGSSRNIKFAKDIIYNLMFQSGSRPPLNPTGARPGLEFYMNFSNPLFDFYTWNEAMPDARTAFAEGRLAMLLDYESGLSAIKSQNPFLNIGIAPVPQLSLTNEENIKAYGRYWAYTVSHQAGQPKNIIAWEFILHMTTKAHVAKNYTESTNRPPAHRQLISSKINDPYLDVFARQTLIANSWPDPDPIKTTAIFDENIRNIATGRLTARQAASNLSRQISDLLKR